MAMLEIISAICLVHKRSRNVIFKTKKGMNREIQVSTFISAFISNFFKYLINIQYISSLFFFCYSKAILDDIDVLKSKFE